MLFIEIVTNVTSAFALPRVAVKCMIEKGKGSTINISLMTSQSGILKVIAYTAAKSAIEGMTRVMAVWLSSKGILLTVLHP
jgi:NAD(P)-dependent dehydrogenase (short-subunit alcohol dehydrogenase family)